MQFFFKIKNICIILVEIDDCLAWAEQGNQLCHHAFILFISWFINGTHAKKSSFWKSAAYSPAILRLKLVPLRREPHVTF